MTGGAGFIGTRLAQRLLSEGHEVTALDSLHPQVHRERPELSSEANLVAGDVADPAAWDRVATLFGPPDLVYHLAAETGTGQSLTEASRHSIVNVVGTTQLTDAMVRHDWRPSRIVLTSSRAVYGEGAWADPAGQPFYPGPRSASVLGAGRWDPESADGLKATPLPHSAATVEARPTNVYAATKLAQEHLLAAWCNSFDVSLSVLRLQNVYGPGQAVHNAYTGVLTFFATRVCAGDALEVFEDGQIIRDFVFVDDVVSALVAAAERALPAGIAADIGGGAGTSLLEVATHMADLGGTVPPRVTGAYRLGDVRAASADISLARQALGWQPTVTLADGLARLLEWVKRESA